MTTEEKGMVGGDERIVEYNVTDAAIEELKELYSNPEPVNDNAELKIVKANISKIRRLRSSVEERRVELKADALEWGRKVDREASRIKEELLSIENPMKDVKVEYEQKVKAEKEEKARIEKERVQKITDRILAIENMPTRYAASTSVEITNAILNLEKPDEYDYQEFTQRHNDAVISAKSSLGMLREAAMNRETAEIEAKEEARRAKEERARLDAELQRLQEAEKKRQKEIAAKEEKERIEMEKRLIDERRKIKEERERMEAEMTARKEEMDRISAKQAAEGLRLLAESSRIIEEQVETSDVESDGGPVAESDVTTVHAVDQDGGPSERDIPPNLKGMTVGQAAGNIERMLENYFDGMVATCKSGKQKLKSDILSDIRISCTIE